MPKALAIDGGTPVRSTPLPGWPANGEDAAEAVVRVVRSNRTNYWTGEEGRALEAEWSALTGRAHALAVANGTLALELALRALEIGPGDEVVVPARTFFATASAVVAVGATSVVADIDVDSNNLTAATVAAVLTDRTRAVIAVHLGGWPVEMAPLMSLAEERGLLVIEDCAQAHGGAYQGRPLGSLGHAAAFSFCQDKIVPAGEGGLLVLDDDAAYERAWSYRDHGKSQRTLAAREGGAACFAFLVESFGSNWRLVEMASALARVGTAHLAEWSALRRRNALRLADGLAGVAGLRVPLPREGVTHAFYRLYARVVPADLAPDWNRARIAEAILAEGVPVSYGTCAEIYREAAFGAAGLGPAERLPGAAHAHETSLALFVHPTLTETDIDDVVTAVRKVMAVAAR